MQYTYREAESYMYVCMHVCMYVCMYVCVRVRVFVFIIIVTWTGLCA